MRSHVTAGAVERERERACFNGKKHVNVQQCDRHNISKNCLTSSFISYAKNRIDVKNKDRPY